MATMAEEPEPQPQSIQERIKSLNQAHVIQTPTGGAPPSTNGLRPKPSLPTVRPASRPKPKALNGTATSNDEHVPLRERETLPPPTITRTGVKSPDSGPQKKAPPLPSRRQLSPSLPNRRPSDQMNRKASFESTSSASTARTTSGASTATNESNTTRVVRAPAWGEAELPKLPPRREKTEKKPPTQPNRPPVPSRPARSPQPRSKSRPPEPNPPPRVSTEDDGPKRPKLPPRRTSSGVSSAVPNGVSNGVPTPAEPKAVVDGEYVKPPQRKVPPPPPSSASLNKIKQSTFSGGLNKTRDISPRPTDDASPPPPPTSSLDRIKQTVGGLNKARDASPRRTDDVPPPPADDVQNDQPEDVPPPIPVSSRPDLSKIQATKPKPAEVAAAASRSQSAICMKCRDFSGPDDHAARFPRESLPSGDLAWLGNQLTSPFPSLTDKARAIFTWLHHNIAYDVDAFFGNRVKGSTPDSTFNSGLAVCEGYASLYKTLATHGGLEAIVISGHGKGFGHTPLAPGEPVPPFKSSHAWNAVRIDGGQWKLIDPCWGAGVVQGKGMPYKKRFDPSEFIMPNDEFGRRHYPSDNRYFFRDDGRPTITWEEYMLDDFRKPNGKEPLTVYSGVRENHGIGERTIQPSAKHIPVNTAGPIRFQFGLVCEHWTLQRHSNIPAPQVFFLQARGRDGNQKNYLPFEYVPGTGPNGGGDMWYVDVPDARELGTPGQKLSMYSVTSFGDRKDTRGLSPREFMEKRGKIGMGFGGVAAWDLV